MAKLKSEDDTLSEKLEMILKKYSKEFGKLAIETEKKIAESLAEGKDLDTSIALALKGFDYSNRKITISAVIDSAEIGIQDRVDEEFVDQVWTMDGVNLSERLYGVSSYTGQCVRDTVKAGLLNADSAIKIARKLYDGYGNGALIPKAEIPRYLGRMTRNVSLAIIGNNADKEKIIRDINKLKKQVNELKTDALRVSYQNLLTSLESYKGETINKAIQVAMEEKSRYQAERIARTETARAWFEGYIARYGDDTDVWGYRWELSSNHPIHDQCDVCANADIGYGKGLYPKKYMPTIPLHPHCRCHLIPVFIWQVNPNRSPNPKLVHDYIDSLSTKEKIALFGVKGLEEYRRGKYWQEVLRGWRGFTNPLARRRIFRRNEQ